MNLLHEEELKKFKTSENRHLKNIKKVFDQKDKLITETNKKQFERYVSLYWSRKSRDNALKEKYKLRKEKYMEKKLHLEELEKNEEDKKNKLIKRFETYDNKRTNKRNTISSITSRKRNDFYDTCYTNRTRMKDEFNEDREEILDYQALMLDRGSRKDSVNKLKKISSTEKIVLKQLKFEKNLKPFYKKIDEIKSQSILKLSIDKRRKLFKNKKREEAEKKKRDEEEKLLGQKG